MEAVAEQNIMVPARRFDEKNPAAIAAAEGAKALVEAKYKLALFKPRKYDDVRQKILDAVRRPMMADRVEYSKPQGGTMIKGASIRFAELALREWGNVMTDTQVIFEDDYTRRIRVMVLDLETNTSFSNEVSVSKTVERKKATDREIIGKRTNSQGELVFIVKATDEELLTKTASAVSKVLRNEGLRVIPSEIIDEAIEEARKVVRDKNSKDPEGERKKLLDAFGALGVKPSDVDAYLGEPLPKVIPEAMLVELRGIYESLKTGEATWRGIMEGKHGTEEGKKPVSKTAEERLKETLKA